MAEKVEGYGVKSTAILGGHPIHPMFIPFPITFLISALISDIIFLNTTDPFWARASHWLLGAGLITGALAAIAGMIDFFTIRRARNSTGWIHAIGNIAAIVLTLINYLARVNNQIGGVSPTGITLSIIVGAVLLVTAWMGGELAYRFGVGVNPRGEIQPIAGAEKWKRAA